MLCYSPYSLLGQWAQKCVALATTSMTLEGRAFLKKPLLLMTNSQQSFSRPTISPFLTKVLVTFNRTSLTPSVLSGFLLMNKTCCWWLTHWISPVVRPFQTSSSAFSRAGLSWQNDFCLSDTLFCYPVVEPDICLVRPSISPSVSLLCLGFLMVGYIIDALASWDLNLSTVARPSDWRRGSSAEIILLTFTRSKGLWKADYGTFVCLRAVKLLASTDVLGWI